MICKACGKVVPDNSLYCPQCGVPLDQVGSQVNYNTNTQNNATTKEREEQEFIQNKLNTGRLYGVVSIVCSILGLGSFGTLDIIAILCGYLGLKSLKYVPNTYPDKHTAVTLNRAGIICSAGFIILIAVGLLIAAAVAPWIFGSLFSFLGGVI